MTNKKEYTVIKKTDDFENYQDENLWQDVPSVTIGEESYLWVNNGYKPEVIIKVFHTDENIFLHFKAFEKKITIKHTEFGGEVWKDSCVEFFINPFPDDSKDYFNIEINALGIPLIGVGKAGDDAKRYYFKEGEVKDWEIVSSVKEPITGEHGKDFWEIYLKIPKSFFEKHYGKAFNVNKGIANFYKCGDETEFEHYGAWNKIESSEPNFHQPEYFGEIRFL